VKIDRRTLQTLMRVLQHTGPRGVSSGLGQRRVCSRGLKFALGDRL